MTGRKRAKYGEKFRSDFALEDVSRWTKNWWKNLPSNSGTQRESVEVIVAPEKVTKEGLGSDFIALKNLENDPLVKSYNNSTDVGKEDATSRNSWDNATLLANENTEGIDNIPMTEAKFYASSL